ncbi:MAG: glycoside hydrolase family 172 protein [Clostridia bacterium]
MRMGLSGIHNLYQMSNAKSRSICPENLTGGKGMGGLCPLKEGTAYEAAKDLGVGWKVNPYLVIEPGETRVIAEIAGSGILQHIWMTPTGAWRDVIIRFYWDAQENPSVECPVGDFFCMGWNRYAQINALAVCVNPGSAFNCYWPMPFRRGCRITLENRAAQCVRYYYQIDYCLTEVEEDAAYFHAQFRRRNPLGYQEVYTLVDDVRGKGQYVGTYLAWGVHNNGWWGEGEIKFYLDGDSEGATICGTGTEDYFCGSYNFENPVTHDRYQPFSTPYSGLAQVIEPDQLYNSQFRFGMYRFHICDPVYFEKCLKVSIQALGWRKDGRYLPLQDDIASVAFWYQTLPSQPLYPLPSKDQLEVV